MTTSSPKRPDDDFRLEGTCACVLDTNVLLELYSIHDLTKLYAAEFEKHGETAEERALVLYRRQRAAYTLGLAIALHERSFTTFQLGGESLRILSDRVPPDEDSLEAIYVQLFLYYVKDYCLANWNPVTDEKIDEGVKGNACDDILLNIARVNRLSLVTNEGSSERGLDDTHGMRGLAKTAGVQVFTPFEYLGTLGVPFPDASIRFADCFRKRQDEYLATRKTSDHANVREHLTFIGKVYQWCFDAT
jgi:hypothetical protein